MTRTHLYQFIIRILTGESARNHTEAGANGDSITEAEFQALAERWKAEERFTSLASQVAANPAYLRIIGMGKQVLPFIFSDLAKHPDLWFAALRAITGEDPVPDENRGDIDKAATIWLDWARKHDYI